MKRFREGDLVRIDIPDTTDPDYELYHGREGRVIDVDNDVAGLETGDKRDNLVYLVEFSNGNTMHFRWRDLRPGGKSNSH